MADDDHEPNPWGVDPGYLDVDAVWHDAPKSTIRAILDAMGADGERPAAGPPLWIVPDGERIDLGGRGGLPTEGGGSERVAGSMESPGLGYHWLFREDDGRGVRLIVTPGRCHLPPDLRTWGWAVQLYAARSTQSWGIGDLADLRELARWSRELGAGALVVNPLHAAAPVTPQEASPYFPTSRVFLNPLYL